MGNSSVQIVLKSIASESQEDLLNGHDYEWGEFHDWNWKGFRVHWRSIGERHQPPLLFIHGFGASSAHWRNNVNFFAKAGFHVYAIDLIGFGNSEQPLKTKQRRLDNIFWSAQVISFLEEIVEVDKFGQVLLIGNSLGSLVSLTVASYRPDLVKAVIASPLPDPAFMQPFNLPQCLILKKLRTFFLNFFFDLLPLEFILPIVATKPIILKALQFAYFKSVEGDFELLRIVSTPARRLTAPGALRAMCIGMSLRPLEFTAPYLLDQLSNLPERFPTLLLWGNKDKLVPLKLGKMILKQHPWIELLVINDSGHCVHDESPSEFNEKVLNWLSNRNLFANPQIT